MQLNDYDIHICSIPKHLNIYRRSQCVNMQDDRWGFYIVSTEKHRVSTTEPLQASVKQEYSPKLSFYLKYAVR